MHPAGSATVIPTLSMMQSAKKVLVTGATGFIGARCLPRLIEKGYEVHAVISRTAPLACNSRIVWHKCDLLDAAECAHLAESVRSSHLLHLAWIAAPGKFWASSDNLRWLTAGVHLVESFYRT